LPQSPEAERAVLGSLILDNAALGAVSDLGPDDFFSVGHRLVFRTVAELIQSDTPTDIVTLVDRLKSRGELDKAGGVVYVSALTDGVPVGDFAFVRQYVKILKGKARARALINLAQNAMSRALASDADTTEIGAALVAEVEGLSKNGAGGAAREATARVTGAYGDCPAVPAAAYHPLVALYCDAIAPTTEAPDNFHVSSFLTLFGSALGPSVHCMQSEALWPIFYCVLVGSAGEPRKGTAIAKAARAMVAANGRDTVEVIRSLDSAEGFTRRVARVQGVEGFPNGRPAGSPYKPVLFRLSEFRSLLAKANRESGANMTPKLCEAYDRDPLEVATTTNPAYVPEPYISLIAGTSKAYMRELKPLDIEGGLGSRCMFVPGVAKERIPDPPPPKEPEYSELIRRLTDIIGFWHREAADAGGSISIEFDAEARELWAPYYIELPRRAGDDPLITALMTRFHHHTIKCALVYAALDRSRCIGVRHLAPAIAWGDFLLGGLWYIFSEFGLPPWVELERKIVAKVRAAGEKGIARRELQRLFWRSGSEEFIRRMKSLTAPGSELRETPRGKSFQVFMAD
jgi:hypothetical protein